jgi:hypothetical protein
MSAMPESLEKRPVEGQEEAAAGGSGGVPSLDVGFVQV